MKIKLEIVPLPCVGFFAPDFGHHLLMMGRLDAFSERLRAPSVETKRVVASLSNSPGQDTGADIDVDDSIGKSIQQKLFVDYVFACNPTRQ